MIASRSFLPRMKNIFRRTLQKNCEVRDKTNKMQQLDVYYQHFLNMLTMHGHRNLMVPEKLKTYISSFLIPTWCTNILFQYIYYTPLHVSSTVVLIFRRPVVLVQHLVSSLSLGDCSVHRLREDWRRLCTEQSPKYKATHAHCMLDN